MLNACIYVTKTKANPQKETTFYICILEYKLISFSQNITLHNVSLLLSVEKQTLKLPAMNLSLIHPDN